MGRKTAIRQIALLAIQGMPTGTKIVLRKVVQKH